MSNARIGAIGWIAGMSIVSLATHGFAGKEWLLTICAASLCAAMAIAICGDRR